MFSFSFGSEHLLISHVGGGGEMHNLLRTGMFNFQVCEEISNILLMISTLISLTTKDKVFIMSILLNLWSLT